MISLATALVLVALVLCLVSGLTNKLPLWFSVLFLCLALLVGTFIRA